MGFDQLKGPRLYLEGGRNREVEFSWGGEEKGRSGAS